MSDEYVPDATEVRLSYAGYQHEYGLRVVTYDEALADFDRWLAAHDAEVGERIAAAIEAGPDGLGWPEASSPTPTYHADSPRLGDPSHRWDSPGSSAGSDVSTSMILWLSPSPSMLIPATCSWVAFRSASPSLR